MKRMLLCGLLAATLGSAQAQELLPREDALKYAFAACQDLKQMLGTPIPTDPDVKCPIVARDGEYGGMFLPETKLSAASFDQPGQDIVSVGQLWLHKLAPMADGWPVSQGRLLIASVELPEGSASGPVCALAVRKTAQGAELLIYGKGKEPVVRVPAKAISRKQDKAIEFSVEKSDDRGTITLKIAGKYEASFSVTDPEQF